MSLMTKAVLVRLTIEIIGSEERNRAITSDVNSNFLHAQAGFYHKCKIDRAHLKPIRTIATNARTYHREITVPWDGNSRLMSASRSFDYMNKMSQFKLEFEAAVNDFIYLWPSVVAKEQSRLGNLFDPKDYPSQSALPQHFRFMHLLEPIPNAEHLILDIEGDVAKELQAKLEKDNQDKIKVAKHGLMIRLLEPIERMADICGNDKKVHASMIERVESVTKIVKEMAIDDLADKDILEKIAKVENILTGYTKGQITGDKNLKSKLGQEAQNIANEISSQLGYMVPQ